LSSVDAAAAAMAMTQFARMTSELLDNANILI